MNVVLNQSVRKWVSLSAFLGLAAFLLYLYFFTNIGDVASIIRRTNLSFYSLVFVCVLASVAFNALAWHSLLNSLAIKVKYSLVFKLSWVGIFVDAIIPGGWSGDGFAAYLLSRDPEIDGGKTAASIVIKNVLELLIVIGVSVFGLILLALNYTLESGVLIIIGTTIGLLTLPLIIIIYLSVNLGATKKIIGVLRRLYSFVRQRPVDTEEFEEKIGKTLEDYHNGLHALKTNPKTLFQTAFFQTIAWSFDIMSLFLVFASIGYIVSPDKIIITNIIAGNLQSQGIALVGFAQVVSSSVYTVLGISPFLSAASTVLAGFASFWFKVIIAFFAFQFVVFSRCLPPFCMHLGGLRGKSQKDETLVAQSNSAG
jgi:uncharacterized protein (TIRG00374 family)